MSDTSYNAINLYEILHIKSTFNVINDPNKDVPDRIHTALEEDVNKVGMCTDFKEALGIASDNVDRLRKMIESWIRVVKELVVYEIELGKVIRWTVYEGCYRSEYTEVKHKFVVETREICLTLGVPHPFPDVDGCATGDLVYDVNVTNYIKNSVTGETDFGTKMTVEHYKNLTRANCAAAQHLRDAANAMDGESMLRFFHWQTVSKLGMYTGTTMTICEQEEGEEHKKFKGWLIQVEIQDIEAEFRCGSETASEGNKGSIRLEDAETENSMDSEEYEEFWRTQIQLQDAEAEKSFEVNVSDAIERLQHQDVEAEHSVEAEVSEAIRGLQIRDTETPNAVESEAFEV
ncbi:hypothetical protein RUND412_002159 [Rhizina undulata]